MSVKCVICYNEVPNYHLGSGKGGPVECKVCGTFRILEYPAQNIFEQANQANILLPDSHLLSGVLREKHEAGIEYVIRDLDELRAMIPKNLDPLESLDRLLIFMEQRSQSFGEKVLVNYKTDYPIAYAKGPAEMQSICSLAYTEGYTESNKLIADAMGVETSLTYRAWERLREIKKTSSTSNKAFVAMWFNDEVYEAYHKGIRLALEETGYEPMHLGLHEDNGHIDDLIISQIRESSLMIADYTGQRQSVYFETGYAMGLGIPVIRTCREEDIKNLHFDARQYSFIEWTTTEELKEKLINRIKATVPRRDG